MAKLISRGKIEIIPIDKDVNFGGMADLNKRNPRIFLNKNMRGLYKDNPFPLAGMAAHEAEHLLQIQRGFFNSRTYQIGINGIKAELGAYKVQRTLDRSFFLKTDEQVINFLVTSPLYPNITSRDRKYYIDNNRTYKTILVK